MELDPMKMKMKVLDLDEPRKERMSRALNQVIDILEAQLSPLEAAMLLKIILEGIHERFGIVETLIVNSEDKQ